MKILLVEDNLDLLNIYKESIEDGLPGVSVSIANNGKKAIEIIDQVKFDLVISDYTMPGKNGGDVFLFLRAHKNNCPFLLVTGEDISQLNEFKDIKPDENLRLLNTPVVVDTLIEYIQQSKSGPVDMEKSIDNYNDHSLQESIGIHHYYPVAIDLAMNLNQAPCDLYIKLSANKMIKVLKKDDLNFVEQLLTYQRKGVEELFVYGDQLHLFDEKSRASNIEGATNPNISTKSKISYTKKSFITIQNHLIKIGFRPTVVSQAQELTESIINNFSNNHSVKEVLKFLEKNGEGYFLNHAVLCSTLSLTILKYTDWNNDQSKNKIALGSFFHDVSLIDKKFSSLEKEHFLNSNSPNNEYEVADVYSTKEKLFYKNHPVKSAELISKINSLPDVYSLISEHHERPDGTGFPRGIHANRIGALSSIMILSHHLTDIILESQNRKDFNLMEEIMKLKEYYSEGHFKDLINDKLLSVINPS